MIMHALTAVLTGSNQNDQKKILKRGKRFCWPLIFGMILVCLILPVYIGEVDSKEWVFKPREKFNVNTSRWKKSLWRKALKKVDISKKFEDRLPRIPKFRPKKVIKDTGGKKPNPCQLVEKLCLNGGTCRSQGDEWFCDCPATHYGKSCEFLADQTYCAGNMCKNNSTCYSVKSPREVPNPMVESVKACSRQMMRDSRNEECKFTLRLRYQCWCRAGFEGSFCEFTEGLRCCAEDLCNDHGLIEYKEIFNQNHKDAGMNCSSPEVMNACKCHCEEFYSGDSCLTTSPCRDRECLNGGKCVEDENKEAKCECPKPENFLTPTAVQGDVCEKIDVEEAVLNSDQFRNCTPCGDAGFHAYLECMQTQLNEKDTTKELRLEHYFAQKCVVEGQHPKSCREALEDKFCLHAGKCTVSVADLSTFADSIEKPFLMLVPKCECPDGYEGDFCENRVLDECDYKDLETHSESLAAQNAQPAAEDSVPRKLGDEQFFRLFKNRIGTWRPEFYNEEDIHTGFERALRGLGMATYCGEHGLCRPFNEQAGIGCKCALGFKGPRCGQKDACSPDPCSKHTMCVEIPVKDDNEGEGGGGAGTGDDSPTNTCICDNSQSVDPRTHKCMAEHSAEYLAACYKEKDTQQPKCENGGSCYPCALDQKRLKESGLAKSSSSRLALCDERETRQGFRCLCPPGFEPPMCRNGTTPCDYHQCQNGATCVPAVDRRFGDYRCICPPGYGPATNNTLCHDIEDLCLTVGAICRSGKCVEDPKWRRGFRCDCLSGFYGLDCEHFEASSYRTYIDDHYTWTYPLLAFTLIVPLALLIMAFRDKVLSCAPVGRLAQRLWRRLTGKDKGHYKPLEQEEDEGEGAAEGEKDENDEEKAEEKQEEEKIEEKAEAEEAKEPEENENNAIVVDIPQILP